MRHTTFMAGLTACAVALGGLSAVGTAHANPIGVSYLTTVKTSFGSTFSDCFTFSKTGVLTVGGYGNLEFAFQNRATNQKKFQSVSPLASAETAGFAIQFNGYALGDATSGYMLANGSDEFGDSYTITGSPSSSCAAAARSPQSLYLPAK